MNLLQMSIFGGIMILVITIIRMFAVNYLPKKTFLILWGIVLVRLLVPFSLTSPMSAYSFINHSSTKTIRNIPITDSLPIASITNNKNTTIITPDVRFFPWIWGIGAVLCFTYFVIAYVRCCYQFKDSWLIENDFIIQWRMEHKCRRPITIRQTSSISAPLTYGIFHPIILLPIQMNGIDKRKLQYVLAHEYVHIRRFDGITKLIVTIVLCIHWFNPFVWVMYVLANRDIELSCDEKVVRIYGEVEKSSYALTLIDMEEKKVQTIPFCNSFSKNATEERIEAIMKMKKTSMAALAAALCLIGGVTTVFATSADKSIKKPVTADTAITDTSILESMPTAFKELTQQEVLDAYGMYDISFNENGKMLYNGELVRYFWDGYVIEDYGRAIHYEYINKDGNVDIHTTRSVMDNKDGSVDPFGDLTGIVRYKEKDFEFYSTDLVAITEVTEARNEDIEDGTKESIGRTFTEIFSEYAKYGIEYKEEHVGSGNGNVYFNGQLVKQFIDESPNGGVFSYHSKDGGKITIQTIYDNNGTIIGVEKK